MAYNKNPPLAQGEGSENVPMANHEREVLYSHGHSMGEATDPPKITRYHRGPWRPGTRQYVFGSQSWSSWQAFHGTHTKGSPEDPTNNNRAKAKPVRIWDRSQFPQSTPPSTFYPNPSQLSYGNLDASGLQLPLTARRY